MGQYRNLNNRRRAKQRREPREPMFENLVRYLTSVIQETRSGKTRSVIPTPEGTLPPREPQILVRIHESDILRKPQGTVKIRPELSERLIGNADLFGSEIGEAGEAITFQSIRSISTIFLTTDQDMSRYLEGIEANAEDVEMRAFPLKTIHNQGPDFYFADKTSNRPIAIVDVKSTTRRDGLKNAYRGSINDAVRHLAKEPLTEWSDHYQLGLSDIRCGLAIGIYFDRHRIDDPSHEITYRMALVKKIEQTQEGAEHDEAKC